MFRIWRYICFEDRYGWMNGAMTEQEELEQDEQDNVIDTIFEDEND